MATAEEGPGAQVRVWDFKRGVCLAVLKEHASGICALDVSPDARSLVAVGLNPQGRQLMVMWDIEGALKESAESSVRWGEWRWGLGSQECHCHCFPPFCAAISCCRFWGASDLPSCSSRPFMKVPTTAIEVQATDVDVLAHPSMGSREQSTPGRRSSMLLSKPPSLSSLCRVAARSVLDQTVSAVKFSPYEAATLVSCGDSVRTHRLRHGTIRHCTLRLTEGLDDDGARAVVEDNHFTDIAFDVDLSSLKANVKFAYVTAARYSSPSTHWARIHIYKTTRSHLVFSFTTLKGLRQMHQPCA